MGIIVKNLKKEIAHEVLFENLNIVFPESGLIHIYGHSGCGKTALLHIIAGIDTSYSGEVTFNKRNITSLADYQKYCLALMPTIDKLSSYKTVYEECIYSCRCKQLAVDAHQLDELLEKLGLKEFKNKRIGELSGGMKQRVCFIQTVLCDCPVMLFDEPTSALDEGYREKIYKLLKLLGRRHLVIVVSHDEHFKNYTQKCIDFNNLENQYIFSYQPYMRLHPKAFEKSYGMIQDMIKLIIHQRKKVFLAFITQIYMAVAIFLMVSGISGLESYYQRQYLNTLNHDLIMIQRADQKPFDYKQLNTLHGEPSLLVELGSIEGINYMLSQPINEELKQDMIIVNEAFYQKVDKKKVNYTLYSQTMPLEIKEVISDGIDAPVLYYSDKTFAEDIKAIIKDETTCYLYDKDAASYLSKLDKQYEGRCDVYDLYLSYGKMVETLKGGVTFFIVVALLIGIILLAYIVLAIIYDEMGLYVSMKCAGATLQEMMHFYIGVIMMMMAILCLLSLSLAYLCLKLVEKYRVDEYLFSIAHLFVLPEAPVLLGFIAGYMLVGCILCMIVSFSIHRYNLPAMVRRDMTC